MATSCRARGARASIGRHGTTGLGAAIASHHANSPKPTPITAAASTGFTARTGRLSMPLNANPYAPPGRESRSICSVSVPSRDAGPVTERCASTSRAGRAPSRAACSRPRCGSVIPRRPHLLRRAAAASGSADASVVSGSRPARRCGRGSSPRRWPHRGPARSRAGSRRRASSSTPSARRSRRRRRARPAPRRASDGCARNAEKRTGKCWRRTRRARSTRDGS